MDRAPIHTYKAPRAVDLEQSEKYGDSHEGIFVATSGHLPLQVIALQMLLKSGHIPGSSEVDVYPIHTTASPTIALEETLTQTQIDLPTVTKTDIAMNEYALQAG